MPFSPSLLFAPLKLKAPQPPWMEKAVSPALFIFAELSLFLAI